MLSKPQIQNLSDTELNRAMIWLYWEGTIEHIDGPAYGLIYYREVCMNYEEDINYLADYNLLIPLAIKANLNIDFIDYGSHSSTAVHHDGYVVFAGGDNPQRSICESLVYLRVQDVF